MSPPAFPPIRVTIAQGMWGIAACGVLCAWPWLLLLAAPGLFAYLVYHLRNWHNPLIEPLVVVGIIGILIGLLLPAVHTNCRRRSVAGGGGASPVSGPLPGDDPARLTTDGKEKARPIWSPDGKRLTFARHESGGSHIWLYVMVAGDEKSAKRLTDRKPPEFHAAFFPDGKRLALATVELSGTQGNVDIAVINADGSGLKKVVGDLSGKLSHQDWPSPSPAGDRFAFSSTHEGNQEIYTCKDDGTDVIRLTQSPGHDAHPSWSPKGDRIAFATDRWSGMEIATAKPDGTGLTRLTTSPGLDDFPAISPDGSRVAFVSHRTGDAEIFVMDADGSDPANITNHPGRDTQPCWTPDGSGITFVSDREGGCDLYTIAVPPKSESKR